MSLKGTSDPVDRFSAGNCLIDRLSPTQRNEVLAQCERVELASGTVLCDVGKQMEYVYFPTAGNISLVRTLPGHEPLQTASVGREGMLGVVLILNTDRAAQRGVVQTPSLALRMKAANMVVALQAHPALLRILQRYLYVVLSELSQTAGCLHFHDVRSRLARGLLLAHDQAQADQLHMTHQCLADMLGVQRGAVTLAASKLQQEGIIHYRRGNISILDRKGLEASACGCYEMSVENYASMLS